MQVVDVIKQGIYTDSQIRCKITAAVKCWLKDNGYDKSIFFRYVRGTYHFDNCGNYMLSAKGILEAATGLKFTQHGSHSMARLASHQLA
jgi:hypothetical protein